MRLFSFARNEIFIFIIPNKSIHLYLHQKHFSTGNLPDVVTSMPLYYKAHLEWFEKYLGGGKIPFDSKKIIKNLEFSDKDNL